MLSWQISYFKLPKIGSVILSDFGNLKRLEIDSGVNWNLVKVMDVFIWQWK